MINTKQGAWLLGILGLIMVILLCILFFAPAKKVVQQNPPVTVSGIEIISPKANEGISLPIKITGVVNGNGWAGFEGQVGTVELKQGSELLGRAVLEATTDWMTFPVSFKADLSELLVDCVSNDCLISGDAELVFHNENPSDMRDKDKTFTLPVKIN